MGNVLTNDNGGATTNLDLVNVTYNNQGHSFDGTDATNDSVTINLAGGGTVKIWQDGSYQVDATSANVSTETFYDLTSRRGRGRRRRCCKSRRSWSA